MERFNYNMRYRIKNHLILEDIYNEWSSGYYILYESKTEKCRIGCLISIFDIIGYISYRLKLYQDLKKYIFRDLPTKIVTAVNVC